MDASLTLRRIHLDFDDAYQYSAARRYGLLIVSFDADFDRTTEGRVIPLMFCNFPARMKWVYVFPPNTVV